MTSPGASAIEADRVYTLFQIAVGSFLGTIVAGILMLSANYRTLGFHQHATRTKIYGLGACPLLIIAALWLLSGELGMISNAVFAAGMWLVAGRLQGKLIAAALQHGDEAQGALGVVGTVVVGLVIAAAMFLPAAAVYLVLFG